MLSASPIRRALHYLPALYLNNQQKGLARQSRAVFAYGGELYRSFKSINDNTFLAFDSSLEEKFLHRRQDSCQDKNHIKLLRIAAYMPYKDYECLFRAIRLVRDEGYPVSLDAYGSINNRNYYEKLKEQAPMNVHLYPPVEHGPALFEKYRGADIQVISSYSEGIPRTILEGAANSLPLVSTRAGGVADIVEDGKTALLSPVRDPYAMARGIIRMIEDHGLRQNIIKCAYELAASHTLHKGSERLVKKMLEMT
jgi:glycosyltransferase involved in cell wall biosynthesis